MKNHTVVLTTVFALSLTALLNAQTMSVDVQGGGLGETLSVTVDGPSNAQFLMIMSLSIGPTPLPPPHISSIDVGFDLVNLSMSLFYSSLPASGTLTYPLPVPTLAVLDNLNLNFQALEVQSSTIVSKSNLWRVTFDTPGEYAPTLNNLNVARAFCTVNNLGDGTILVAGGGTGTITAAQGLNSAEIYHPNLESFEPLPNMSYARALHRATTLQNGQILLTGGVDNTGIASFTAEVFDPTTNSFVATGYMSIARVGHTSSILPDGRVLITGGSSDLSTITLFAESAMTSTEIYDPATMTFSPGPNLSQPKTLGDATALADGRVVVTGGITYIELFGFKVPDLSNRAQVYTPSAGSGSFGGNITMTAKRAGHTSIALSDGRALLVGGGSGTILAPAIMTTCELLNTSGTGFSAAGSMSVARALAQMVTLSDGTVLTTGGVTGDILNPLPVAACEIYSPAAGAAGSWASAGSLGISRGGHGMAVLSDGTVGLFAGGGGPSNSSLDSAEIYQP